MGQGNEVERPGLERNVVSVTDVSSIGRQA